MLKVPSCLKYLVVYERKEQSKISV